MYYNKCLICDKNISDEYLFCRDCHYDILNKQDYIIASEKDYYKLKNFCYKIKNKNELEDKLKDLFVIANELSLYVNKKYEDEVIDVIEDIKEKFKNKNKSKNYNQHSSLSDSDLQNNIVLNKDLRNNWEKEHLCEDGHYVRSLSEMLIDNWLYNHKYVHAYEKLVFMKSDPNANVLSDFYLPQGDVYIEFWGLNDEQYLKRKQEKIKLYDKNHINRIDLTENDIKRLNDILPKLLAKYIKE